MSDDRVVLSGRDGRVTATYAAPDGDYRLADVDAAENGFTALRRLYDVPGCTRADYELLLEETERALFDRLDGETLTDDPRPADYGLAEQAAARDEGRLRPQPEGS